MRERVLKTISRYQMLGPRDRVVTGVSGGADSVCLLHVLREAGVNVTGVAHLNHKLRGDASDEDERFVGAMASGMGIPFYRSEVAVGEARGNLEQAGRRARREFLLGLIRDGACERVALGHTRDDQAETVLFRVLRGAGLTGLSGIRPVNGPFIRPLIGVTRCEVENYLRERGIQWREDASNRETRFARKRIRHELLPQLRSEWNPKIVDALANLADLAYEEERYWAREPLQDQARCEDLRSMPRAAARRVVRELIAKAKGDLRGIEFQHIEQVLEMTGARVRLPGVEAIRSCDLIRVRRPGPSVEVAPLEVTVPGTYAAPDGTSEIRLEACANLRVELAAPLFLRGWRPGDHYRPVGKSRDHKLKEMFQKARVPSWHRPLWPILENEGKILWAREFGPAEGAPFRITETFRASIS